MHFVNINPHSAPSGNHVTTNNLDKTRSMLVQAAHEFCKPDNVSSC